MKIFLTRVIQRQHKNQAQRIVSKDLRRMETLRQAAERVKHDRFSDGERRSEYERKYQKFLESGTNRFLYGFDLSCVHDGNQDTGGRVKGSSFIERAKDYIGRRRRKCDNGTARDMGAG